jgi:lauroyl/myristoyl acyltransferase
VRLEELVYDDLPDNAEGRRALSQRYVDRLESVIQQHTEQWLWGHKKWKNTPEIDY